MSQPRTRLCANEGCDVVFEYTRSTARYHSDTCRKQAQRRRRQQPIAVEEKVVVLQHYPTGRKRDTSGDWVRLPVDRDRWQRIFDRIAWKLTASDEQYAPDARAELRWEAVEEFIQALYPIRRPAEFRHIPVPRAVAIWRRHWKSHPELSPVGRLEILTLIPQSYVQAVEIEREKERTMLEIEKVKLQNELILARQQEGLDRQQETLDRLERLQELAAETFARVADTARRVGEKFPNNAEVAAAVDRLLEDIGMEQSEDELP
jgi:hypothetical protein